MFCRSPSVSRTRASGADGPSRATHLCVALVGHATSSCAGAAQSQARVGVDPRGVPAPGEESASLEERDTCRARGHDAMHTTRCMIGQSR